MKSPDSLASTWTSKNDRTSRILCPAIASNSSQSPASGGWAKSSYNSTDRSRTLKWMIWKKEVPLNSHGQLIKWSFSSNSAFCNKYRIFCSSADHLEYIESRLRSMTLKAGRPSCLTACNKFDVSRGDGIHEFWASPTGQQF